MGTPSTHFFSDIKGHTNTVEIQRIYLNPENTYNQSVSSQRQSKVMSGACGLTDSKFISSDHTVQTKACHGHSDT